MSQWITILAAVSALLPAGCVPSVQPLFTDRDVTWNPGLVGAWVEKGKTDQMWTVRKAGDKSYEVVYTEKGQPGRFDARLVRLGPFLFIDLAPREPEVRGNALYRGHLIGLHSFARIWIERDVVRLAALDEEWLKGAARASGLPHLLRGSEPGVLLTASTRALQAFVLKHAEDPKAFSSPLELRRRPS